LLLLLWVVGCQWSVVGGRWSVVVGWWLVVVLVVVVGRHKNKTHVETTRNSLEDEITKPPWTSVVRVCFWKVLWQSRGFDPSQIQCAKPLHLCFSISFLYHISIIQQSFQPHTTAWWAVAVGPQPVRTSCHSAGICADGPVLSTIKILPRVTLVAGTYKGQFFHSLFPINGAFNTGTKYVQVHCQSFVYIMDFTFQFRFDIYICLRDNEP
jgi:hypothetical protein